MAFSKESLVYSIFLVFIVCSQGQLDSRQRSLALSLHRRLDGSSDLSQTFSDLRIQTDHIEDEINRLSNAFDDLVTKLESYLGGHPNTRPTDTPVSHSTSGPVTSETPIVSSCVSGMSHDHPRVVVTLPGNVRALCDTETDGGGWIVFQRRTTGGVDFYKNWNDYKSGFGTPDTDFWLGNDVIHSLTAQGYTEFRVDLEHQGSKAYAHYSTFRVGDEGSNYKLTVSGYTGTAGDSLSYHNGMSFTTSDRDNDEEIYYNCGEYFHGAWWYRDCFESNLNGEWGKDGGSAIIWKSFVPDKALSFTEMKVRHV